MESMQRIRQFPESKPGTLTIPLCGKDLARVRFKLGRRPWTNLSVCRSSARKTVDPGQKRRLLGAVSMPSSRTIATEIASGWHGRKARRSGAPSSLKSPPKKGDTESLRCYQLGNSDRQAMRATLLCPPLGQV